MNTQLEPPPVPPLGPSQRARLRNQVMDRITPRPARRNLRWAVPVISVAAVGLVVAGTLAIGNQMAGAPAGNTPVAGAGSTVPRPTQGGDVAAVTLDRGPATAAEIARVAKSCQLGKAKKSESLWSRRVVNYSSGKPRNGVVVLLKSTPGQPGVVYRLGLSSCWSIGAGAAVRDSNWIKIPDRTEGLVTLSGFGGINGAGVSKPTEAGYEALHRVRPEISRIESRYVWKGASGKAGAGKWYQGIVVNGIAYTASSATIPPGVYVPPKADGSGGKGVVKEEIRAFDSLGNPVPVKN